MQSTHDREAKRIKQWVEFLIVIFGLATILALVYSDGWVLVPLAAIFVVGTLERSQGCHGAR